MYLFYLNCVYYFLTHVFIQFMYLWIHVFMNSCIYWIHVFIIFEYMYLLFLTNKLFLYFYLLLLFQDRSFAISILWLNDIHI